jgi:hypothetical protein
MKLEILRPRRRILYALLAFAGLFARPVLAQTPAASTDSIDAGWPRQFRSGTSTFSVYQPQVDSWKGNRLDVRAAVAVQDTAGAQPAFGVIWLSARTDVDKTNRIVSLEDLQITKASFPSAPGNRGQWQATLQRLLPDGYRTIALDRLESDLTVGQEIQQASTQPLRNEPPQIIFSTRPAILVPIDSQPVLRPAGRGLQRVINTRPLLLRDGGTFYLHVFDGWMQASALSGRWTVAESPPGALTEAMQAAVASNQVDLLEGAAADSTQPAPSLYKGPAPTIYVSTEPAELVVTNGAPDYVSIPGTQLLYVQNTTGRVFKSIADNDTYVLISGRWYRAPSASGPWTFVPGKALPVDFARIPDSSPMENVKASVPGTAEAREAVIANAIPQTATVKRAGTTLDPMPTIDGGPEYRPIEGTPLRYVLNASVPIIETGPREFYAVQNGVWFVANSVRGPWAVAASVPAEIYAIPRSSPLHYVTYVQVYDATPDVVYVGYTPGYYGTVLDPDGVVVYGTGYYYNPWIGDYWFGFPCTYGFGAGARWTPWTGWGYGYGFGWSWGLGIGMAWGGWGWGVDPWWGPSAWWWGPHFQGYDRGRYGGWGRGWGGTSGDVYARWGGAHVVNRAPRRAEAWTGGGRGGRLGVAYNSHTGMLGTGQRVPVRNIYSYNRTSIDRGGQRSAQYGGRVASPQARPSRGITGGGVRGAPVAQPRMGASAQHFGGFTGAGGDIYAGSGGQVYRRSSTGGWEQHAGNNWQHAGAQPSLNREVQARAMGEQRTQGFRSMGGFHGGFGGMGGGMRGGGGHMGGGRR